MSKNPNTSTGPARPSDRGALTKQQNAVQRQKDASFKQHDADLAKLDRQFERNFDRETKKE